MAGTAEGKVKDMVKRWLAKHYPDAFHFLPVSAGFGKHGIPDFICCIDGVFVGIECKVPGKHPTELQRLRLEEIVKAGGFAGVIRCEKDLDEFNDAMNDWDHYGRVFDNRRS